MVPTRLFRAISSDKLRWKRPIRKMTETPCCLEFFPENTGHKVKRPLPDSNRGWRICNPNSTFVQVSNSLRIAVFLRHPHQGIFRLFPIGVAKGDTSGDTFQTHTADCIRSICRFQLRLSHLSALEVAQVGGTPPLASSVTLVPVGGDHAR